MFCRKICVIGKRHKHITILYFELNKLIFLNKSDATEEIRYESQKQTLTKKRSVYILSF